MGLVSFGEKYELRKGRAESILVVSLGRDAELEIKSPNDGTGTVGLCLEWGKCTFEYDTDSASSKYMFKSKAKGIDLTFEQSVPDNKWYLVPSPIVKVEKSFKKKNISLEGKADLLDHKSSLGIKVKPTAWSNVDVELSKAGLSNGTVGVSRKMKELHLDSCGLKYNIRKGPEASMACKPLGNTKAKAKLMPRFQMVELGMDSTINNNGKKKTEWTATCKVDYHCNVKAACVEYKWFF
uniref:Uncharacterized protein n=1 Tax=Picocystis salinarum TaxID=88271 RepID=A0A7S3XGF6_9CHLO|mmetsp:Transcript_8919/g.54857  ORF Transcript_8919/g.54857 Transcript_8919/m.54857 type:complete len:238 (-) Transcript_8919:1123-1836(-)